MSVLLPKITYDGPRNTGLEVSLNVDSEDISPTVILDPRKNYVDPTTPTNRYRLDYVNYILHKDLQVDLWWEVEGEEPKHIRHFEGRGFVDYEPKGGLTNDAGENKTGCIMLSATGGSNDSPARGSLTIEVVKQ